MAVVVLSDGCARFRPAMTCRTVNQNACPKADGNVRQVDVTCARWPIVTASAIDSGPK
jgi:hypothetical protein